MFDGPNAFQNMMQTAVKIKGAQMKSQREKFDLYPTHLQNSMFHKEEIVTMRSQPFEERLAHAIQQKNLGVSSRR